MNEYYADGYRIQIGLVDVDILFTRRGNEQATVTLPLVLVKSLAQQLDEVVELYQERLGSSLPEIKELEKKFGSVEEQE